MPYHFALFWEFTIQSYTQHFKGRLVTTASQNFHLSAPAISQDKNRILNQMNVKTRRISTFSGHCVKRTETQEADQLQSVCPEASWRP